MPPDHPQAMVMLGLNPGEQEVVDIPNELARNGLIYFPDFCQIVLERIRNPDPEEENFRQMVFKVSYRRKQLSVRCTSPFLLCVRPSRF